MASLVHVEISEIQDDQLRPVSLLRTRRGYSRPANRGGTTSSSVLADTLQNKDHTLGGEGGRRHKQISSLTVLLMVTVLAMDQPILANESEFEP